ncbi:S8 family anti-phage peptidase IteS [Dongshaea marina]|uniref:S8 family anti-phage peptidase IteS n=1 Tax=Dongshaea marina TaxID=2047966 RepID=UPI000D3E3063|nr:S8 family anti-phage peptidase IteS [Dongshaea marina]
MDKRNNPIQVVQVNDNDHRKMNRGGGASTVFGDGATNSVRAVLAEQTTETLKYFSASFKSLPAVAGVAKVTLRKEALAKSHRPLQLFNNKTCPIVGTLDFGELLVSATSDGLDKLKAKILDGKSQKIISNISAIEKIEPYSELDRLNGIESEYIEKVAVGGDKIKLKLFDHQDLKKNNLLKQALKEFADEYNIQLKDLKYGKAKGLMSATLSDRSALAGLAKFIGLRSISPIPKFKISDLNLQASPIGLVDEQLLPSPKNGEEYPVVGVIDSGVCPSSTLLEPWILARENFVPPGQEDYTHGTMVAGLIINSKSLNYQDERFPETQAMIVDVNVFPKDGGTSEDDLVAIIEEVVPKYPQVRVWNLSLGSPSPVHVTDFSDFARFLDEMHDEHGCLFVVSSGNQNDLSYWPTRSSDPYVNRVSSPGDSVRALTVGSVSHKTSPLALGGVDDLSPFSRIGPGPSYIPKPEIIHYGGNATANGNFAQIGILSIGPNNTLCENIGTSFSAPIGSSIAGNLFHFLSEGEEVYVPTERVKALMIHSALMSSNGVSKEDLRCFGFGKPGDVIDSLYCDPNCMTMLFETDVRYGGFEFERFPFPIPDCLNTSEGKYKGEVFMTLVYSPVTDPNYASEYCRTNVEVGMGSYNKDGEGNYKFASKIPPAPKDISEMYEKSRVENGFKWSPVKAYHRACKQGIAVGDWRLKLGVMLRAEMGIPDVPQRATLILSLRGLDPEQPVYNETIQKMNQMGWITHDIDQHVRLRA